MYHLPDPDYQPEFYSGTAAKRLIAFGIDFVVIFLLSLLVLPFTLFLGILILPLIMAIVGFMYRVVTLASGSATFGMRFVSLELRQADGSRFDMSMALMHTGAFYVSMAVLPLQIVSILLMLMSARGQGLSDHILGTVALNRRARLQKTYS